MNQNLPSIKYTKGITNPTITSKRSFYDLEFEKGKEYFNDLENFVSFVKAVERIFRSSDQYKKYAHYIKFQVGMKRCQLHNNIEETEQSDEKLSLEMHHGPIFTLFDLVSIIVDDQLKRGERLTTFKVADIISEEHFNNNIQVVILCKTCHELVHDDQIKLHYNQAFGNIINFLKKYKLGITKELFMKMKDYIEDCRDTEYFSNEVLELDKTIARWDERFDYI